ncbi:RB32B-like protein [Mya arenaria]|uniref:RB32B-like protein n=1 Tax=Mya arenaria TaxID=6604 RepID=A0ABY7ECM4_MYAAR|nr:RB32B-like protein [Mya arenaria]
MGNGCSSDVSEKAPIAPLEQLPALKIAIVGDPGVGKTSVLLRYLRNQFSPLYIPTKKVAIENVVRKVNVPAHTVVSLTFWDIPGREDMDIHKAYFRNLDAAIVVVDLTNKATIDMANVWRQTVVNKLTKTVPIDGNNNPGEPMVTEEPVEDPFNFPVLLLGNKLDIIESEIYEGIVNKQVSVDVDADGVVTVSAKQSDNSVAMAIQSLVRNILEKRNIPRKWRPVVEEPKPPQNDQPFIYDKLKKTDMEKYDEIIVKADEFLKETMVLRHYYTYAAVSKAILRDGPSICIGLEKYDKGFDKMYANFASHQAPTNEKARDKNEVDPEEVANKIVHNRAKIQHAKQEMEEAMKAVEQAARKIANVEHW